MNTRIKNQIESLAKQNPTEEICGIIYYTLETVNFFPCTNIALDKSNNFEIAHSDYLNCLSLGKPYAIYHSHDSGLEFSSADKETADEFILPMYIYSLADDKWNEYIPSEFILPLEGQPFIWGLFDCYETIRIQLRQERNIYVGDYDRDESFENSDSNIVLENFEKENFVNVGSTVLLKRDDILLFNINRAFPQHFGVYRGNSRFLHHPLRSLSRTEILTSKWLNKLEYVLRYKNS